MDKGNIYSKTISPFYKKREISSPFIMPQSALTSNAGKLMVSRTLFRYTGVKNQLTTVRRLQLITAFFAAVFYFAGSESHADIYRYIDESGVECFTDTPTKKGAVRIMKDQKSSRQKIPVCKPFRSPRLPGAEKSVPEHGAKPDNGILAAYVLPVQGAITSPVGMRHDPIDGLLRHHNGADIAVPEGTPVKPLAPGVVSFSGLRPGYGNMVIIAHDDGMVTLYGHNSVCFVKEGERVAAGSTIALSGSTGRSTGPHLHFEAWKDGVNMTMTFLSGINGNVVAVSGLYRREDRIRRSILADGSLLFTNLP
jgi:murein DD-endopeptidase MepM/ murein hydrolase activator NlpD